MRAFLPLPLRRTCTLAVVLASAGPPLSTLHAQQPVTGRVKWSDTRGNPHPVRNAAVQMLDADRGTLLDTARTDDAGAYRFTLAAPDVRTVTVVVRTQSPHVSVGDTASTLYEFRSGKAAVPVGTDSVVLPDIIGLVAQPANQAFGLVDAIEYGAAFRRALSSAAPPPVEVVFPTAEKGTKFLGGRLHLRQVNAWDWDVVLHEYGHYVARLDSMTDSVGGQHFLNKAITLVKKDAVRLAWAEGWATWFSITAQREAGLGKLGIPDVGDSAYRDSSLKKGFQRVDLNDADPPWSGGERSEVTVMRVLYDLADDHGGKQGEVVSMGVGRLWGVLRKGQPNSLWGAWKLIAAALSPAEQTGAAAILEAQFAAPMLLAPEHGARLGGTTPVFMWIAKGMADVALIVRGADGTELYRRGGLTGLNHLPDFNVWAAVVARAGGGPLFWRVQASDADAPETGPYPGTERTLVP